MGGNVVALPPTFILPHKEGGDNRNIMSAREEIQLGNEALQRGDSAKAIEHFRKVFDFEATDLQKRIARNRLLDLGSSPEEISELSEKPVKRKGQSPPPRKGPSQKARKIEAQRISELHDIPFPLACQIVDGRCSLEEILKKKARRAQAQELVSLLSVDRALAYQIVDGRFTVQEYLVRQALKEKVRKEEALAVEEADKSLGMLYFKELSREKTPVILRTYGQRSKGTLQGTIAEIVRYDFYLDTGAVRLVRWKKLKTKLLSRAADEEVIKTLMKMNHEVAEMRLDPVRSIAERYVVPDHLLEQYQKDQSIIQATMRGGEMIQGSINWYDQYHIHVNLGGDTSLLLFRHALYNFEVPEIS